MKAQGEGRGARPAGVTVLACVLVIFGILLLCDGMSVAARHPEHIFTGPSLVFLGLNWFLPAIWIGATGVGLFRGRSWARGSFLALSALVLIALAGLISGGAESREERVRIGVVITAAAICGWGVWYLLGGRVKRWFR